jgi:AraC-like DNA-binding protein
MNKRNSGNPLVIFGFGGSLQDDLERHQGVLRVANREGWQVLVLQEHFEQQLRKLLAAGAVDGVIGEFISESWLGSLSGEVPFVHVGQHALAGAASAVMFDPRKIGAMGCAHLLASGYARVSLYTPTRSDIFDAEYVEAFLAQAAAGQATLIHGQSELSQMLVGLDIPTGIFCLSDYDARCVIRIARGLDVPIPDMLGVLGVGNRLWDRIAAELEISSIPLSQEELGEQAALLLREQMAGAQARSLRLAPLAVLARESTMRQGGHYGLLVRRVETAFHENLALPFSIKTLCRRMGFSQRTLELAFRAERALSPYRRLLEMRMEESRRLLGETDLRVNQIGERVGYPDPQQFSAFFRARQGQSPTAYRGALAGVWGFLYAWGIFYFATEGRCCAQYGGSFRAGRYRHRAASARLCHEGQECRSRARLPPLPGAARRTDH